MKKAKYIIFSILIFTIITSSFLIAAKQAPKYIAKATSVKGNVKYFLKTKTTTKKLKANEKLSENTIILTGKKSKATIMLKNGSLINLKENSKLIINKELFKKSSTMLIKGSANFKINKVLKDGNNINIYTPTAVVGIRGTEFDLQVADDGSLGVNVEEGKVGVNNDENDVSLEKDQSCKTSLEDDKIEKDNKKADLDKWQKDKAKETQNKPVEKMRNINKTLEDTLKDQKELYQDVSDIDKGDSNTVKEDIDKGFFNQAKSEGLKDAAEDIYKDNSENGKVSYYRKKINSLHNRIKKFDEMLEKKFTKLDEIYETKSKSLDEKSEKKANELMKRMDEIEKKNKMKNLKILK